MARASTNSHILELEMIFGGVSQPAVLERLSHSAASIYNACLGEALKRLHTVQHDREYQALREEYKSAKAGGLPLGRFRTDYRAVFKKYGYTEYALQEYAAGIRNHYPNFGSAETQALATRAFNTVEKVRTGKAENVRFKSPKEGISFEGKGRTSKLHYDEKDHTVHYGQYRFGLKIKPDDEYAAQCMQDKVKYVRVLKRTIRGRQRWFCQLVLEGTPPDNGRHRRVYGDGKAGIDPGVATTAVVTDRTAHLYELAPDIREDEKRIRRLQRAADRSRRATNPGNYEQDGTVRKGRKHWEDSKRYLRLKSELAEAHRLYRVKREMSHHSLAKEILAEASDIRTETMSFSGLAKRSGHISHNRNNGRIRSRKRYGKTIHNRAPSRLISILDEKLSYIGKSVTKVNTFKIKASQYNPLDGSFSKKELKDRMVDLGDGNIVQRDLLSAYIILNTSDPETIDAQSAYDNFNNFKQMNDIEVDRLRTSGRLSWYIN